MVCEEFRRTDARTGKGLAPDRGGKERPDHFSHGDREDVRGFSFRPQRIGLARSRRRAEAGHSRDLYFAVAGPELRPREELAGATRRDLRTEATDQSRPSLR